MIFPDNVLIIHFAPAENLRPLRNFLRELQYKPEGRIKGNKLGDYQQWFNRLLDSSDCYPAGKACYHGKYIVFPETSQEPRRD